MDGSIRDELVDALVAEAGVEWLILEGPRRRSRPGSCATSAPTSAWAPPLARLIGFQACGSAWRSDTSYPASIRDSPRGLSCSDAFGKRDDIVSSFALPRDGDRRRHEPAGTVQYAADVRVTPPRADAPGDIPFLIELVELDGAGSAVIPLDELHLEAGAPGLPAFVPEAEVCKAHPSTSTSRTGCWSPHGPP